MRGTGSAYGGTETAFGCTETAYGGTGSAYNSTEAAYGAHQRPGTSRQSTAKRSQTPYIRSRILHASAPNVSVCRIGSACSIKGGLRRQQEKGVSE
eukprot:2855973-Rhodomonas_salina.2